MIQRRTRPLQWMLALAGTLILLRLFWIQVVEHSLWRLEAARLVHAGREIPYRRGRILDTRGRVLARDSDLSAVVLVYRDFRRGHPLGQVAHARSLLEGRAVSLVDARAHLAEWCRELVLLTPAELQAFARGERGPEARSGTALDEQPFARRANDLGFYLRRLLDLDARGWKRLQDMTEDGQAERSFLELAACVKKGGRSVEPAAIQAAWRALEKKLERSLLQLERLARLLVPAETPGDSPASADPLTRLVADLERARRWVEDATAAKLFAQAADFAPGRLEPSNLLCFDHGWIAGLLAWDDARVAEWAEEVRAGWTKSFRDEQALARLLWDLVLDPARPAGPADFVDRLGVVFAPEGALAGSLDGETPHWYELDRLAVFASLPEVLAADVGEEELLERARCLPIQLESLRADPPTAEPLRALGAGPEGADDLVARHLAGRRPRDVDVLLGIARGIVLDWDARFQAAAGATLAAIAAGADAEDRSADGKLVLSAPRRDRATERAESLLMDYGTRPRPLLTDEPSDEVIYLLTRYEADFPGFQARDARARELPPFLGEDELPAAELIGRVSAPTIQDFLRQRSESERLRELQHRPERSDDEQEELARLIGEVLLQDEVKGVSGIEAYFDEELTGENGYAETRGLEDVFGQGGEEIAVKEPKDGEDVSLTLDVDLQRAAQRSLRTPLVPDDPERDAEWLSAPVGAIVLVSIEGEVLAAASEPDEGSLIGEDAQGQRESRRERTLTKPTFQPPGSVFKPFVAAWALDRGLDPTSRVTCGPLSDRGGFGYVDLRCWNKHGHGTLELHDALVQSCNAYFAWVGETLPTSEFLALADEFGFGQATGVRSPPPWAPGLRKRSGLVEHGAGITGLSKRGELSDSLRRMAGNGLGAVEATPMQLARGMVALATGEKRDLRLVRAVGARELPLPPREPLGISRKSLDFVREAMAEVASNARGTAHAALAPSSLGLEIAVKTGSADLTSRVDADGERKTRKHTWVGGWVPAEDPRAVFVVFEHDTSATSSHGAIYLARQFLLQPEVLDWLGKAGVDVSAAVKR